MGNKYCRTEPVFNNIITEPFVKNKKKPLVTNIELKKPIAPVVSFVSVAKTKFINFLTEIINNDIKIKYYSQIFNSESSLIKKSLSNLIEIMKQNENSFFDIIGKKFFIKYDLCYNLPENSSCLFDKIQTNIIKMYITNNYKKDYEIVFYSNSIYVLYKNYVDQYFSNPKLRTNIDILDLYNFVSSFEKTLKMDKKEAAFYTGTHILKVLINTKVSKKNFKKICEIINESKSYYIVEKTYDQDVGISYEIIKNPIISVPFMHQTKKTYKIF